MLSVTFLIGLILGVVMLDGIFFFILSVVMLGVILTFMLNVIMLGAHSYVCAKCHLAELCYTECHYAECHIILFMQSAIFTGCCYVQCHYAEWCSAECHAGCNILISMMFARLG